MQLGQGGTTLKVQRPPFGCRRARRVYICCLCGVLFRFGRNVDAYSVVGMSVVYAYEGEGITTTAEDSGDSLALVFLAFDGAPISVVTPLIVDASLRTADQGLLLNGVPVIEDRLLRISIVAFVPLTACACRTGVLGLYEVLINGFYPFVDRNERINYRYVMDALL